MLGLKNIFSMVKSSYLPAFIFGMAVFIHSGEPVFLPQENSFLHLSFYILSLMTFAVLLLVNRAKSLFALLWVVGSYLAINNWKAKYGTDLMLIPQLQLLLFLLPINWCVFVMEEERTVSSLKNFYFLCIVLCEAIIIENFGYLPINSIPALFDMVIWGIWVTSFLLMLGYLSVYNQVKTTGMFFAFICLWCGLFDAANASGLTLYFSAAVLILLLVSVQDYVYGYFRDNLTGVYSRNSYYRHSHKSFPLKYSIGVFCIDDYAKLLKVFGRTKVDLLTRMVINRVNEAQTGATLYRYNEDEFILVFKNEDKKQSYEYMEAIRRLIAGAEFALSSKKIVKITISAGVSEKKRSDADVDVVLMRTREVLQKAYRFTQNITSKA